MLDISFAPRADVAGATLVLGVWEGGNATAAARSLDGDGRLIARVLAASSAFTGAEGQHVRVEAPAGLAAERLLVLGLGPFGALDAHRARRLGGVAAAVMEDAGGAALVADLDLEPAEAVAFAQGLCLRAHRTPVWQRPPQREAPRLARAVVRLGPSGAAEALWPVVAAETDGVLKARDLVDAPGGHLTPSAFVEEARGLARLGVQVDVIQGVAALRAAGCGLLAAVGQGSAEPPALVTLRWPGARPDLAPLALAGKGITFDTGGLSLKPGAGMEAMKADIGGAAAVFGAVQALAAAGHAAPVTGVLAIAENAVGGGAMRPGDIYTARNGRTVEIIDTDAEGRLVLADALATIAETLKPAAVVDIATLTGAVVTTLGRHAAGLFTADDRLAALLSEAAETVGEPVWRLPLTDALDADLESPAADLRQCAPAGRFLPDALHAARFLQHFAGEAAPWAHLDMAGVGTSDEARPLSRKGATGWGVRLLVRLARDMAAA